MMSLQRSVVDGRRSLALNNVVTDEFRRCAAWMTLTEFSNSTRLTRGRRHHQTSGPHVPLSLCAPRSRRQRSRLLYKSHTSYVVVSFARIYTSASAALKHLVGFHGMNNHYSYINSYNSTIHLSLQFTIVYVVSGLDSSDLARPLYVCV